MERYQNYELLRDFYNRWKKKVPAYQHELDQLSLRNFPEGIRHWQPADESPPPSDGQKILSDSPLLQKAGLHPGEIIVALDGVTVHNGEQYDWICRLTTDTHMDLEVWDGQKYHPVHVDLPGRKFQCLMATYQPPS